MYAELNELSRNSIKQVIPPHCFKPSTFRSLRYFVQDVFVIVVLYAAAWLINSSLFYPLFWFMSGTMLWALFVIGHDCGHGSFSKHSWLNYLIGSLCHSVLLVPFHGWKTSHRKHHVHTGSFEHEDPFAAPSYTEFAKMSLLARMLRYKLFLIGFPFYLLGIRNKYHRHFIKESHFFPSSSLFKKQDRVWVILGTLSCLLLLLIYIACGFYMGWQFVRDFIVMPYLVFIMWLAFVTYLQHVFPTVPVYRKNAWTSVRGALSTIDYDFGIFNKIHHHINIHVVHHLFPLIPHYHLKEATQAIKPLLGSYYRQSHCSPIKAFIIAFRHCHYVDDAGDIVFFKKSEVA